ncbi:hypothetical protein F511_04724 [Dorcoceras hygrometricum]|uniref:Uncharacterized protein n=1 Tax=Dorcoceras hygrometricum TaxID=472368 RepID=A0A2Z7AZE9_9LAMI|nr:hypothetical protein F511_04724 [Dorcoceras hygrometricum]
MDQENKQKTVTLDEKNRAKLVNDKPARPEEGQLREDKIGSGDLVKLDAYERDETVGSMISLRRKPARNKLRSQQCLRVMNKPARCKETGWLSSNESGNKSSGQEQERTEQEQLCTKADDKIKLEISSREVANKRSRVKKQPARSKDQVGANQNGDKLAKLVKVKSVRIA